MDNLLQDVRYALRSLARSPGFAVAALLTVALGIGANTAMFSVVNGLLLRPLPFADADRLVRLHQASAEHGVEHGAVSAVDLEDWRERTRSFAEIAAFLDAGTILGQRGAPLELRTAYVTEGFFAVLGTPVQLGRPLLAEDARQAARTVVISDRLWRGPFAADPSVVGGSISLSGESYTVVGVMPARFGFPAADTDVWTPYSVLTEDDIGPRVRDNRHLQALGRLMEGVSPERAVADLTAVAAELEAEQPGTNRGWGSVTMVPLRTAIVGNIDRALLVLLGAVGFILLIGCANLANLLLARGSTRSREIAIRTALGAGRSRLLRLLLTESLVLALLGGALGLLLSFWGMETILGLSADTLPRVEEVSIDARVVGFGVLLAVLTGLLFGLLPALRVAAADPQQSLRGGRGAVGGAGSRARSSLVVAEVALAVLLVIGAGLMARSFLTLRATDPGFDPENVLAVTLRLNTAGVADDEVTQHILLRRQELMEAVAALPGVQSVAVTNRLPLHGEGEIFEFHRADGSGANDGSPLRTDLRFVSHEYFRAMGIPLLQGTGLPDEIAPQGAPVAVVISEATARRFWPGQDPVGQVLRAAWGEAVVAGVVGDVRQVELAAAARPAAYIAQHVGPRISTTLVVRTAGDPIALSGPVRAAIQRIDADQPIRAVATLRGVMSESIARDRFFTTLFVVFGGLALLLAAVGIYGVLAYTVGQRTREIGVRMALGADARDVVRMVVRGGMLLVGTGVTIGTIAAVALTRVLESQLHGVSPTDPATFAAVALLLGTVAVAASYLPARRAARVDPMTALRSE